MFPLTIAVGNYGLTKPLKDGSVATNGLELQFVQVDPIVAAMRRMVRGLEFDICEMAIATYLCAKACNKPITAIPIFLTRNFHHRALLFNTGSGIRGPKDLEGRTVVVNRGYTVTTGLWARGILQTEYGVDLRKITWAPTDDEHVAEYKAPANVDYSYVGQSPTDLLVSGRIAAAVGDLRVDAPNIRPLFPDARDADFASFRKTGIYPINHVLVIKNSLIKGDSALASKILGIFQMAKSIYMARLHEGRDLSPPDEAVIELAHVVGDPFPFGVRANSKTIDSVIQFALDQQVISKGLTVLDLFARDTLET